MINYIWVSVYTVVDNKLKILNSFIRSVFYVSESCNAAVNKVRSRCSDVRLYIFTKILITKSVLELADRGQVMTLREDGTTVLRLDEHTAWKYFRNLVAGLDYRKSPSFDISLTDVILTRHSTPSEYYTSRHKAGKLIGDE